MPSRLFLSHDPDSYTNFDSIVNNENGAEAPFFFYATRQTIKFAVPARFRRPASGSGTCNHRQPRDRARR